MITSSNVTIVADEHGEVIRPTKNPDIGYVQLRQVVPVVKKNWINYEKRYVNVFARIEDLEEQGLYEDQELPGKIIVKEALWPFNEEDAEKELKRAGEDGPVCRVDDQPVYRKCFYTLDPYEVDQLIQHTNVEEIRDASAAQRVLNRYNQPPEVVAVL